MILLDGYGRFGRSGFLLLQSQFSTCSMLIQGSQNTTIDIFVPYMAKASNYMFRPL